MNPLLVFDLDGTLIDSAPDIIVAVNRTLANHSKPTLSDELIIAHIGEGIKKLIADLFKDDKLEPADIIALEMEFLNTYEEEMLQKTRIYPGVEDFLSRYQGPMGIITNKNELPAKVILKHLGLDKYPWVNVFGADTLEERKPSPLPLRTMMKLAGRLPGNTLMIGDGIPDMVSAQRAGVGSIAIGFGYTATPILEKYEPLAVLEHYQDLHGLVKRITVSA
ncbi:N-acetylmuramic acid 6-phosphate phosphatase [Bdellovibrio bacteriovorus]|uniref:HAD family hydrolase n=1 Tax=Bdellovibrio bacteriovorus TaxID=959 RepID=UPI00045C13A6|nr:HAD-IA family hydrolase [Bdellovibrio bacteriovorus]AHZ86003.1 phosphoglycolate phosphatase [Bdellovibrio bacteriovorus]BEV66927.1 N-acetylmuramic acid 6-phosphate phosphatase [Bdellovibrio bacteriovorus]